MTKHQNQEHDSSSQQVELNIKVVNGSVKRFDSQLQKLGKSNNSAAPFLEGNL